MVVSRNFAGKASVAYNIMLCLELHMKTVPLRPSKGTAEHLSFSNGRELLSHSETVFLTFVFEIYQKLISLYSHNGKFEKGIKNSREATADEIWLLLTSLTANTLSEHTQTCLSTTLLSIQRILCRASFRFFS